MSDASQPTNVPVAAAPLADGAQLPAIVTPGAHAHYAPAPFAFSQMTAQPQGRPKWVYAAVCGLFVFQLFAPHEVKPTTLFGGVMADWVRQTTSANVENQILLAKSQKLAEGIAQLEADYADKIGKCGLVGLFGLKARDLCVIAADQYYKPALNQARIELARIETQLGAR